MNKNLPRKRRRQLSEVLSEFASVNFFAQKQKGAAPRETSRNILSPDKPVSLLLRKRREILLKKITPKGRKNMTIKTINQTNSAQANKFFAKKAAAAIFSIMFFGAIFSGNRALAAPSNTKSNTVTSPSGVINIAQPIENSRMVTSKTYNLATKLFKNYLSSGETFETNIPNGMITSGSVNITIPQTIDFSLQKDDKVIDYKSGNTLKETGSFLLKARKVGQTDESAYEFFAFQIFTGKTGNIDIFNAPSGFKISAINKTWNQVTKSASGSLSSVKKTAQIPVKNKNFYVLKDNAAYEITIIANNSYALGFSTTIDHSRKIPRLTLTGIDGGYITGSSASYSSDLNVTLTKDGKKQSEAAHSGSINKSGTYIFSIDDGIGNQNEFKTKIKVRINKWSWVLMAAVVALLVLFIMFSIKIRGKLKIR
jgi:hypothetical protein